MVTEFGMSKLGRIYFADGHGSQFLGGPMGAGDRDYSERTAREIDVEARRIIDDATHAVRSYLSDHQKALEAIAQRLIEKEVLDGAELRQLLIEYDVAPRGPSVNGVVAHVDADGGV